MSLDNLRGRNTTRETAVAALNIAHDRRALRNELPADIRIGYGFA